MTRSPIFTFSRFECCLPTYKFKDSHSDHKKPTKLHHVKPIASPQRAPVPKLLSQPEQTEATVQDTQQSPYAGGYPAPSPAAGKREFHAKQSSKKIMYSGENKMNKQTNRLIAPKVLPKVITGSIRLTVYIALYELIISGIAWNKEGRTFSFSSFFFFSSNFC